MSAPIISIDSTTKQTAAGSKTIKFKYTLSNIASGALQEFYVKPPSSQFTHMSEYDSSASDGSFTKTLDLTDYWNDFGNYTIRLWVYNSSAEGDADYEDVIVSMVGDRPDDFTFPSSVRSGAATTTVTASKWNSFQDRINEFQAYKGVAQTSFYDVEPGDEMTASLMRKAWDAINGISGHGTMPTRPSSGATIYASWFHDLADALNDIE